MSMITCTFNLFIRGFLWLLEYKKQLGLSDKNTDYYHIDRKIDFFEDTQKNASRSIREYNACMLVCTQKTCSVH